SLCIDPAAAAAHRPLARTADRGHDHPRVVLGHGHVAARHQLVEAPEGSGFGEATPVPVEPLRQRGGNEDRDRAPDRLLAPELATQAPPIHTGDGWVVWAVRKRDRLSDDVAGTARRVRGLRAPAWPGGPEQPVVAARMVAGAVQERFDLISRP